MKNDPCSPVSTGVFFACMALGVASLASAQVVILEDDFEDNSAGWTTVVGGINPVFNADHEVNHGFDYSTFGIPEAPNSDAGDAATLGVRLLTNKFSGQDDSQTGITLVDPSIAGQYTVQVDMWMNYGIDPARQGTTEHGGVWVGSATSEDPIDPRFPVQNGAGAIMSTDNDCINCQFILQKNRAELDTFSGQYSVTQFSSGGGNQPGYDSTDVNTNPDNGALINIAEIFPSVNVGTQTGGVQPSEPTDPGTVGFRWVTITIDVDPTDPGAGDGGAIGTAAFTITDADTGNELLLGTVDNSVPDVLDDDMDGDDCDGGDDVCANIDDPLAGDAPVDLEGQITLGLIDFFTSTSNPSNNGFALFDNLIITAAEDPSLPGDFNSDTVVDALDYAVWREGLGVDFVEGDLQTWKDNYGASAGSVAISTPEPTTLLLASTLLAFISDRPGRRARRRC